MIDPSSFRLFGGPTPASARQTGPSAALRDLILDQIMRSPRDPRGVPPPLYRNSAVFAGSTSSAKAAANEYAQALFQLDMIISAKVAIASVTEGEDAWRFGIATRRAELSARVRKAFDEFKRGGCGVLFLDVSHAKEWCASPVPIGAAGPALLSTLARELAMGLSLQAEGHVVIAADEETIRALYRSDQSLPQRWGTVITV